MIENNLRSRTTTTSSGKNEGGKAPMFNIDHSVLIMSSLVKFMTTIVSWRDRLRLACAVELKIRTSKKALCLSHSQKPSALMSNRAAVEELAKIGIKVSPVSGCKAGSTETCLHTSLISLADRLRMPSCRIEGKPPKGQLKA